MLRRIVEGLFPQHDPVVWPSTPYTNDVPVPRVTVDEVRDSMARIKVDKAPEPDGIPNVAL